MSGRALAALRRGRRAAEALMLDQCTVTRTSGPAGPLNPETGTRTPAPTTTVYAGRCKVQTHEPHESRPQSGGHVFTVQRYAVHLPISTSAVQIGDRIEVTAAVVDPQLAGRHYEVTGTMHKSLATAQRLLVEEVTG